MLNKSEVAALLSDRNDGHVLPLIEAEPFDDENGLGNQALDRWLDRLYSNPIRNRWAA